MRNTGLLSLAFTVVIAAGAFASETASSPTPIKSIPFATKAASNARSSVESVPGMSFDLHVSALAPLTWSKNRSALLQSAWDIGIGAEVHYDRFIPVRIDATALSTIYSFVNSAGQSYRPWSGARFALSTGIDFPLGRDSFGVLVGGALSAGQYQGTVLLFAYSSMLAELRFDTALKSAIGFRASLPLELMFRGGSTTFSPSLRLGIRLNTGGRKK